MHTFVAELKKEAKKLDISPTAILREAGFSEANWYNWKGNKNNPSEETQKKLRKTIQSIKTRAADSASSEALLAQSVPVESKKVKIVREESPQKVKSASGEKTLSQILTEKKREAEAINSQIEMITLLLSQ